MRRRDFIAGIAVSTAMPLAARTQQSDRVRRIGVLMNLAADDPEGQARFMGFLRGLQESASASVATSTLQQTTRTVPIVFVSVVDPVTGTPGRQPYRIQPVRLRSQRQMAGTAQRGRAQDDPSSGPSRPQCEFRNWSVCHHPGSVVSFGVELHPIDMRDAEEIERAVAAFAHVPNGGLIVVGAPSVSVHRQLIITLAARHQLPAVYPLPYLTRSGGLIAYGPNIVDSYRRAASYVDRILKGEKPADLPVQAPTKYELTINLKTARALGLDIPPTLLARADEVIE